MRNGLKILFGISTLMVLPGIGVTMAQETLPPGEGMERTVKICGNCHSVGTFRNIRRSEVAWDTTINNMVGWGMTLGGDDYDVVMTYLTTYLGTTPPPPAPK